MPEQTLTNAMLVLPDSVVRGTVVIDDDGWLADVQPGVFSGRVGLDLMGDHLIPGIVDVHTDNLERQVQPRVNARWPSRSAVIAHDAQCAAAGVTTVLDALCLGALGFDDSRTRTTREGVSDLDAFTATGLLKSEHYLHLRCELPAEDLLPMLDPVADHVLVRMVSLMDHTPGIGQHADLPRFRAQKRKEGYAETEIESTIALLSDMRSRMRDQNRRALLARLAGRHVALASHDDQSEADVAENAADGIELSEFPVTMEAARAARAHRIQVIAGAPNVVRGVSHSGNVAATDLIRAGAVDALASDYVPAALIEAAFLANATTGIALPEAIAMVTSVPAGMARLYDRGALRPGLRADLVRLTLFQGLPVVRAVWRAGERVA